MKGFDSYDEIINRYFLKYENNLYCTDKIYSYALKWNGENWEKFDYNNIPEKAKNITPKAASKIASIPPWEVFNILKKRQEEDAKQYWENLIKTTNHKVIGYINTAYGSDLFMSMENGKLSDEEYAAIIKDYRKNGYMYSGEDFQDSGYDCTPVLDNYCWIDFSRRGFGGLIARSLGDYSEMGYSNYTESMFLNPKDLKFPKGGLNKGVTRATNEIEIDDDTFALIKKELKSTEGVLVVVPMPKIANGFYWIDDGITICFGQKHIKAKVKGVVNFDNKDEFKEFLKYRHIKCVYHEKILDNSPLLLVSV